MALHDVMMSLSSVRALVLAGCCCKYQLTPGIAVSTCNLGGYL